MCGVVAVFVPILDQGPPVRGSVISELCHSCLRGQAVDSSLLGDNEETKSTGSLDWCNPRRIHIVSPSLFLLLGAIDSKGICTHNSTIY